MIVYERTANSSYVTIHCTNCLLCFRNTHFNNSKPLFFKVPIKIKDNFHIIPQTEATTLGFDYDYYSVMHYQARAFLHKLAGRGKFAMTAFGDKHNRMLIGGTLDMTRRDYDKVNALYSCALGRYMLVIHGKHYNYNNNSIIYRAHKSI